MTHLRWQRHQRCRRSAVGLIVGVANHDAAQQKHEVPKGTLISRVREAAPRLVTARIVCMFHCRLSIAAEHFLDVLHTYELQLVLEVFERGVHRRS